MDKDLNKVTKKYVSALLLVTLFFSSSFQAMAREAEQETEQRTEQRTEERNVETPESPEESPEAKDEEMAVESAAALSTAVGVQFGDYHPEKEPLKSTPEVSTNDQTGALSYDFAITAPPGRAGMQPDLTLSYNSQNTDLENIAGLGWGLNIPYIERLPRKGLNKLYSENYFYSSLSGEISPISLIDETHGDYGAKVESGNFLKHELNSQNQWVVTSKSGLTYTFGASAQARQDSPEDSSKIYRWMLEEIRDSNDNFISYEYNKISGQIYPAKITYTGHGSEEGIFEIVFGYEDREDRPRHFDTGFEVETTKRLSVIEAKVEGEWRNKYELGYVNGDNGSTSLLGEITESGRSEDGSILTLPSTKFDYQQAEDKGFFKDENYTIPSGIYFYNTFNFSYLGTTASDVNGDGLADLMASVGSGGGSPYVHTFLNKGDGTGWAENTNYKLPEYLYTPSSDEYMGVKIADVNGDNLPDILKSVGLYKYVYINKGDGTGWLKIMDQYDIPVAFKEGGDTGVRFFDINNDGLTDLVQSIQFDSPQKKQEVYLNKGDETGWTKDTSYILPPAYFADHTSNKTDVGTYVSDINLDGLPDIIVSVFENWQKQTKKVYINKGDGTWIEDTAYLIPVNFLEYYSNDYKAVRITDVNADGLPDIIKLSQNGYPGEHKVFINSGDSSGWVEDQNYEIPVWFSFTGGDSDLAQGVRIVDVNGDGTDDIIQSEIGSSVPQQGVYINRHSGTNLLSSVSSSGGAKTDITYQATTAYKSGVDLANPKLPMVLHTVKQVSSDDGFGNLSSTTYQYEGGEYFFNNPNDRKFAGFNKVIKTDHFGNEAHSYFHQGNSSAVQLGENLDHKSKINMMYRQEIYDNSNKLYSRQFNKWENSDLGNERNFVRITETVEQSFDGNSSHKDRAQSYAYDINNGNLTQEIRWGQVSGDNDGTFSDSGSDKITTDFSYATNGSGEATNLVSHQVRKNQNTNKIGETRYYYDDLGLHSATKGNLTKEEHWVSDSTYIDIEKSYNQFGLITEEKDPKDNKTVYSYDNHHLYPQTVTNELGHTVSYSYDYSSGQPTELTDANGHSYQTVYDALDRKITEKQPDQNNPSSLVTKTTYQYNDSVFPRKITTTKHLDSNNSSLSIAYLDGFGRLVQEKNETENSKTFTARDYKYNALGLLDRESLPYFSPGSNFTPPSSDRDLYISYNYDALKRVTAIKNALGSTENIYDEWMVTTYDPMGNRKDFVKDARDQLVEVKEYLDGKSYSTNYQYDSNGNLTKITDNQNNLRNFTYDALGRRLSAEDLHASGDSSFGSWSFAYDAAGNLIQKITPASQTVTYDYDKLNRVISESVNGLSQQGYSYDDCENGIGQLCSASVSSHGVVSSYSYWPAGNRKSETIESSSLSPKTTSFEYDRLGNLKTIQYPDNQKASYEYDAAGMLEKVLLGSQTIVQSYTYTPMGQIDTQKLGNKTEIQYVYDADELYRLKQKLSVLDGKELQNLNYTYDAVGNILQIEEKAEIGLQKESKYIYDDLYRLTKVDVKDYATGQNYDRSYEYDPIGNILYKSDQGQYEYGGGLGINFANPHAVTGVAGVAVEGVTYKYDKNGNLVDDQQWKHRWNYNNRLVRSSDGNTNLEYYYDHEGDRIGKMSMNSSGSSQSHYINDYYDIDDGKTKHHIYAGNQKIASISEVFSEPVQECTTYPDGNVSCTGGQAGSFQTVYHLSDHLSSSSVDVNQDGEIVEKIDYYPFGSVRIDETGESDYKNNYKFTGHELDDDTGLYYAGARYYNSDIGRFVSEDPASLNNPGQFLTDPQQLNLYSYTRNNPVKYVDPSGEIAQQWIFSLSLAAFDGPLPFGDAIAGAVLIGSLVIAGGQAIQGNTNSLPAPKNLGTNIPEGNRSVHNPPIPGANNKDLYGSDSLESAGGSSVPKPDWLIFSKTQVFPENPNDFNPEGLIKKEYEGKRGNIIKWLNPESNKSEWEWHEDVEWGNHYHKNGPDGKGHEANEDGETHLKEGSPIPN